MTRIEPVIDRRRRRFRDLKSVPVLPSMVTLGNLFFGFLAMAYVADAAMIAVGQGIDHPAVIPLFERAAVLIFVAMVFDGIDGAVARLTNQVTSFGAQLDSLADAVTFGVAPAFVTKVLVDFHAQGADSLMPAHPKLYYAAAAIYVICAAMRLARFNVEVGSPKEVDHREFSGLPSPAAAAVVCSLIAFFTTRGDEGVLSVRFLGIGDTFYDGLVLSLPFVLGLAGLLMVSRFPYPHLVNRLVRGRHSFPFFATLVVLIFIAAIEWQLALVVLSVCYLLSGMVIGLWRLATAGRMGPPPDSADGAADDPADFAHAAPGSSPGLN